METIGTQQLWSWLENSEFSERTSNTRVRNGPGHLVRGYLDLAYKVADLQFRNRDFVLLFRGQARDYTNRQNNTSLRPSILRNLPLMDSGELIRKRYERLALAERLFVEGYLLTGRERVRRQQLVRWSILQHYEVCDTPLLDVSQSIRIAASFASQADTSEAFFYVLGVPNISGAITASAEASIAVLRLASVCPPEALRPHIQEGYLLSEYPELVSTDQKSQYEAHEMDFGLRLVAKFRFNPQSFWAGDSGFPIVSHNALYPDLSGDPLFQLTQDIRNRIGPPPS